MRFFKRLKRQKTKTFLFLLVFLFGLVALPVTLMLSTQSQDIRGDAAFCSGAFNCSVRCNDGHVSSDICPAFGAYGSCGQWANDACGTHGGVREMVSDGGTGQNYDDGSGNTGGNTGGGSGAFICPRNNQTARGCRNQPEGTVVPFGNNESCTCRKSGNNACGCVANRQSRPPVNPPTAPTPIPIPEQRTDGTCPNQLDRECQDGFFCAQLQKECRPKREVGQECGNPRQCLSGQCNNRRCSCLNPSHCPDNHYCNNALIAGSSRDFQCKPRKPAGSACKLTEECESWLTCRNDRCL